MNHDPTANPATRVSPTAPVGPRCRLGTPEERHDDPS